MILCTFHVKRAWLNFLLKHVRSAPATCAQHIRLQRPFQHCTVVCRAMSSILARAQVKRSALRQDLFHRVSAILDGCGVPASGDVLLRAEVHNQLRRFLEDFSSEPLAAVFIEHISAHYAGRPGELMRE